VLTVVQNDDGSSDEGGVPGVGGGSLIDRIVRDGARQMLAAALRAEVAAYIDRFADQLDENGRRLVVRNGYHDEREVITAAGAVAVKAPRVNDKRVDPETGERQRFSSAILPAWARKSTQVNEVLPLLYLHGLSSGDFGPALEQFLGTGAGLSASAVTRLTAQWQGEAKAFAGRDLSGTDYVYLWVDGIHLKVRLDQEKLCLLVMIGVRADGRKELVALTDGYRESSESWGDLLRDCRRRGMTAPVLAVGDGALGFWKAVREVFPATREQRCWFHKQANVLGALPKSAHPGALAALKDIYNAEDIDKAQLAIKAFEIDFGAKYPKAVAKIVDDMDVLLEFFRYPAEHWVHLRTTNPIESTFATVRFEDQSHQGLRFPCGRARDGLQAHRGRPEPVAHGERAASGCPRPVRSAVPQGQAHRAPDLHRARRLSRIAVVTGRRGGRLKRPHP
jgi:transposase-like protein